MLKSILRSSAAFVFLFLWTATVSAQQDGQAGGDTGTGGRSGSLGAVGNDGGDGSSGAAGVGVDASDGTGAVK